MSNRNFIQKCQVHFKSDFNNNSIKLRFPVDLRILKKCGSPNAPKEKFSTIIKKNQKRLNTAKSLLRANKAKKLVISINNNSQFNNKKWFKGSASNMFCSIKCINKTCSNNFYCGLYRQTEQTHWPFHSINWMLNNNSPIIRQILFYYFDYYYYYSEIEMDFLAI